MIAATAWYYARQRTAMENAMTQELAAVAEVKVKQIVNWRSERLGDGRDLQSSPITRIARRVLSSGSVQAADRADLLDSMQKLEEAFLYTGAALVGVDGNIRLESTLTPSDPAHISELGKAAARRRDVELHDLYWDAKLDRPLMALTAPVEGVGAFVLTIDPDRFLYPFVSTWPVPSATAETVLVRRDGDGMVYLNGVREKPRSALLLSRPFRDVKYPQVNDLTSDGKFKVLDYRGVPVLGMMRRIPHSPWYLIAKIDASEVDAPAWRLAWEMGLIIALIALANAAGAGFVWRSQQLRVYREREEWLRDVANETPAYLWMTTPDGENSFINEPLAEFFGVNKDRLGKDWKMYFHPDDADRVFRKFLECVTTRCEFLDEHRLRRFDGEYRWFIGKGRPRFSPHGDFLGFAGSLFDITERNNAEQSARESTELVEGQNRVLALIAQGAPLPATLDLLVRVIEGLSPDMLASILLLDADGLHLRHGAAPNLPETYVRAIDGEPIGPVAGSCGTAAFRREPVIVEDIATDPLWEHYRDFALKHGLRACWSTPIFEQKIDEPRHVLGTFALYFSYPCLPTPRQRGLIEMATQTAAIAIVRSRETDALLASEERLRLATTAGSLGIWEWRIDAGRLIWSDELKEMFDLPKSDGDVSLESFVEAVYPEDRSCVKAALDAALAEHIDYDTEYRISLGDGSLRWIASHGRLQFGADGTALRMVGVARDITPAKRAQEEINRRQARLVEAQSIAHVGSYEWDVGTGKVYRSEELCRIFGVADAEFERTFEGYLERVHPEDRNFTKETILQALRDVKPFDFEERIVRPNGGVRVLRSQGQWLCDDAGTPVKLTGTCQDITDLKHAEQRLQAAYAALAEELKERTRTEKQVQALSARLINAQDEERARIARELHDDLGQQIAALSIGISNLRRQIPSEFSGVRVQAEQVREKLVQLAESIRRVSHDLHPAVLQYGTLDVALRAYCSEFGALAGIEVLFRSYGSFEGVPPATALCAYRVTQEALQNVAKHANTNEAEVVLKQYGETVMLTISDQGTGMDLSRNSSPGGLGLTSIRERARLVNGTLEIESEPNRGTTLTMTLPIPTNDSRPLAPTHR